MMKLAFRKIQTCSCRRLDPIPLPCLYTVQAPVTGYMFGKVRTLTLGIH